MSTSPLSLPLSEKLIWEYKDLFNDYPSTKLCMAFLHKNYNMDLHKHDFYEINVVVGGEGYHYSGNKRTKVKRGDIFIIPPGKLHGYFSVNNLDVYHALYQDLFFDKYSKDLELISSFNIIFKMQNNYIDSSFHIKCYNPSKIKIIEETIKKLENSLSSINAFAIQTTDFIKSYIFGLNLIVDICDLYTAEASNEDVLIDTNTNLIFKAIDYIHNNYANKIDVATLCNVCATSRTPLFKEFKKITGMTPNQFITNYRLKIGNKLISESDYSIGSIALMVGFYDTSHFIKMYKKQYGNSPIKTKNFNERKKL